MRMYSVNGIEVCKEVFKSVFSINNGRLGRLLLFHDENPNVLPKDRRGPAENQGIDPRVMETVIKVVKRLPKYVLHYGRGKDVHCLP